MPCEIKKTNDGQLIISLEIDGLKPARVDAIAHALKGMQSCMRAIEKRITGKRGLQCLYLMAMDIREEDGKHYYDFLLEYRPKNTEWRRVAGELTDERNEVEK